MRERPRGAFGRATALAEGVAAAARRMQREREPRVVLYDDAGNPRLVQPEARGYDAVLDAVERMVELVGEEPEVEEAEAEDPAAAEDADAGDAEE